VRFASSIDVYDAATVRRAHQWHRKHSAASSPRRSPSRPKTTLVQKEMTPYESPWAVWIG